MEVISGHSIFFSVSVFPPSFTVQFGFCVCASTKIERDHLWLGGDCTSIKKPSEKCIYIELCMRVWCVRRMTNKFIINLR